MKTEPIIKVGILISYDYMYLKEALPRIYEDADLIVLAVDKDGKTWNGGDIDVPESFFDWVKEFDKGNKIKVYRDSFYVPTLTPIECDTRERNLLGKFMGEGGWHIQVDTDEYFLDFKGFTDYLKTIKTDNKRILVHAKLISMYKQDKEGYYIAEPFQTFCPATNSPNYNYVRGIENPEVSLYTDFLLLHQTWARSDEEMSHKIKNWGHTNDFDAESYFKMWQAVNRSTYKYIRSFHILDPWIWQNLVFFETKDIPTLIEEVKEREIEKQKIAEENNRLRAKDFIPVAIYKIKALLFR